MMTPTFTILIGSAGRETLRHTLASVKRQRREPGDQVIVAFDAFEHGEREDLQHFVRSYGPGFEACAFDSGYHFYGVAQINFAMENIAITGTHVLTLGDDDVFVDKAYQILRPIVARDPARPVLHKFLAPWREILWKTPVMERSRISGCCIAAPRQFVGPMDTKTTNADGSPYKEHDFDWMVEILTQAEIAGHRPVWLDECLVIAQPDPYGKDVKHKGLVRCWHCPHWRYLEDVSVLDPHCPKCKVVMDVRELMGMAV